jgi:cysteine desulfurase
MVTRAYLDHAATTPMVPVAIEAMTAELGRIGNPSSLHRSGRAARRVVEDARESIAADLGARPGEVIFTSGGTESDNLAVQGGHLARHRTRPGLVVSAVEHHAVLDPARWLAAEAGAELRVVGASSTGRVEVDEVPVDDRTGLVSVMWANNEIGTLQPVAAIADRAHRVGAWVHSDAIQAVGHVPVDFAGSGLDLLSVTAHKLGGPVGVGALLARRDLALQPIQHGGGQERDVRSGTLAAAAVAGFAAALRQAVAGQDAERRRLEDLRSRLLDAVRAAAPDALVHGPEDPALRLPTVANVELPGAAAEDMLLLLDAAGVDCSTGSACTAGVTEPSHVLLAVGRHHDQARTALRFSLGHSSTADDVAVLTAALPDALARARAAGRVRVGD